MSSKDYVHYVSQKYRVAIALAILKSKPPELTVNQYMDNLKNKLNEKMDVDEISINSNDFNFDEEIFNEFNDRFNDTNEKDVSRNENNDSATILGDFRVQKTNDCLDPSLLPIHNYTQSTYYEESEHNTPNNNNNFTCTLPKTNTIHKESPYFNQTGDMKDITMISKLNNSEMANKVAKNISKQIQYLENNTIEDKNGCNIKNNIYNNNNKYNNNANNMSTDRNEITMDETQNLYTNDVDVRIVANVRKNITKQTNKDRLENDNQNAYYNDTEKIDESTNFNSYTEEKGNNNKNNVIDTQETIIYTLYDITDNNTHISQSQFDNIEIRESFMHGNRNNPILSKCGGNLRNVCLENDTSINKADFGNNTQDRQSISNVRQNIEDDVNGLQDIVEKVNTQVLENKNNEQKAYTQAQNEGTQVQNENKISITQMQCTEIDYIIDRNGKRYKVIQNCPTNKNNSYEWTLQTTQDSNTTDIIREQKIENNQTDNLKKIQMEDNGTEIQDDNTNIENNKIQEIHKDSERELIPFKVIEEMNKVKNYLNKRLDKKQDGYLTDSGYRSDSLSRSSYKSVQMSENWLNQSAYSLYAYLRQCPLVAATDDITKEISQVIGKLIDMLHEEEKYPTFLEDILQNIESLLEDIFKGNSSCDNVLLKKEDNFQRLCLLNRSVHTLQFTINKVTQILEKVHTNLINPENLYEIMNIEEVESLSYIFHIIETLIPKYMKLKSVNLSQTQNQEDKLLKKSSVTEIWRKKWNPNYKEITHIEGRCENKCILIKLSEILNKIVVNCIDGYSLLAFAALQSYNLMQE